MWQLQWQLPWCCYCWAWPAQWQLQEHLLLLLMLLHQNTHGVRMLDEHHCMGSLGKLIDGV